MHRLAAACCSVLLFTAAAAESAVGQEHLALLEESQELLRSLQAASENDPNGDDDDNDNTTTATTTTASDTAKVSGKVSFECSGDNCTKSICAALTKVFNDIVPDQSGELVTKCAASSAAGGRRLSEGGETTFTWEFTGRSSAVVEVQGEVEKLKAYNVEARVAEVAPGVEVTIKEVDLIGTVTTTTSAASPDDSSAAAPARAPGAVLALIGVAASVCIGA